jgi:signal transduction histidine kinase
MREERCPLNRIDYDNKRSYEWLAKLAELAATSSCTVKFPATGFWISADMVAILRAIFKRAEERNNRLQLDTNTLPMEVQNVLNMTGGLPGSRFQQSQNQTMFPCLSYPASANNIEQFITDVQTWLLHNSHFPYSFANANSETLLSSLGELFDNATVHADCTTVHTCGQVFPRKHSLLFTVVDLGISIPQNVMNVRPNLSDQEALEWAIKRGNTTRPEGTGGVGLYELTQFVERNGGSCILVSGNGYLKYSSGNQLALYKLSQPLPGAIVSLDVRLINGGSGTQYTP